MEEIRLTTWDIYKTVVNNGISYLQISTGAGFQQSTVWFPKAKIHVKHTHTQELLSTAPQQHSCGETKNINIC